MAAEFALIHSPLVGPSTWAPVAKRLRERGFDVSVPTLEDDGSPPYWRQETESAAAQLANGGAGRSMILVGHSGAGALLPAIARLAGRPVAGFVFVDAGLPLDGKTRLEEMGESSPEFAERFRAHAEAGGKFPEWSDEDLRPYIPDDHLRRLMVGELHPRPLDFFDEPIPSEFDWAAHPGGYVLFSASYEPAAAEARRRGWPVRVFDAGHFHMLVDPVGVADALIAPCREW